MLFMATNLTLGQFVFSVKPGLDLNGASFGIRINKLILFGGLDYMHFSTNLEVSGTDVYTTYSYLYVSGAYQYTYGYQLNPYDDKNDVSLNMYSPVIGVKYLLGGPEKVDAYITASASKPMLSGSASSNGVDQNLQKYLDNLSIWGFQIAFGGEYHFSENFSIGGEFGVRMYSAKYEQTDNTQASVYVGSTTTGYHYQSVPTSQKTTISPGLSFTYSVLCLNYYF
jgi:hypothetical protein